MGMIKGTLRSMEIDGKQVWPTPTPEQRETYRAARLIAENGVYGAPGRQMGKTIAAELLKTMKGVAIPCEVSEIKIPVNVCDVCGCAHYNWPEYQCCSCRAGIHGVQMQQRRDRLTVAFQRLGEAAAQAGVAFAQLSDNLISMNSGDILRGMGAMQIAHVGDYITVSPAWSRTVPDPIGDIESAMRAVWERAQQPVQFIDTLVYFDEIGPMPPKLNLSTIYGRLGRCWDERKRPTNAKELMEQRKARRQTQRGPEKKGKWWLK